MSSYQFNECHNKILKDIGSDNDDNNIILCLDTEEDSIIEKKIHINSFTRHSMGLLERPVFKPSSPEVEPSPYSLFGKKKHYNENDLSPHHLNLVSTQKNELSCTDEDDDEYFFIEKEKNVDIHEISLFRKKMKSFKRKIMMKRKLTRDFESDWKNYKKIIFDKLEEGKPKENTNKRRALSFKFGRSSYNANKNEKKEKHNLILNFLSFNAKEKNKTKKIKENNLYEKGTNK